MLMFGLGVFVGTFVGLVLAALLVAAKRSDNDDFEM